MNLVKQYIEYLKDNPEGYWFKRKLYGWGWTPAKVEGWLVMVAYLAGVVYFASKLEDTATFIQVKNGLIAPLIVMTLVLVFITYWKGEKPKWQWGKKVD